MSNVGDPRPDGGLTLFNRPITHIGYAVADLPKAVDRWAASFGAGPFYALHGVEFDRIEHRGGPAVFEHDTAFGRWGEISLELWQTNRIEPESALGRSFAPGQLTHAGYSVESVPEESARLEKLGFPELLTLEIGVIEERLHDAPELGHLIEVQPDSDFLRGFHAEIAAMAHRWDGRDPLRPASHLESMGGSGMTFE